MKTNLAQFLVSYVCPRCSDLHRQILAARDMSDAFKQALDVGAISFDIVANPDNEPTPHQPLTLFYEEAGKIHARVFPVTSITEIETFSQDCTKTKKFRGFISDRQAIYTRNGD